MTPAKIKFRNGANIEFGESSSANNADPFENSAKLSLRPFYEMSDGVRMWSIFANNIRALTFALSDGEDVIARPINDNECQLFAGGRLIGRTKINAARNCETWGGIGIVFEGEAKVKHELSLSYVDFMLNSRGEISEELLDKCEQLHQLWLELVEAGVEVSFDGGVGQ